MTTVGLRTAAVPMRQQYLGLIGVLGLIVLAAAVVAMAAFANVGSRMSQMRGATDAAFAADDAFVAMVDQETGVRGYVATGDPLLLAPYVSGRRRYEASAATPVVLDPAAAAVLRDFRADADRLERYFRVEIDEVRNGRRAAAVAHLRAGKALFDRLRVTDRRLARTLRGQIDANRALMQSAFYYDEAVIAGMVLVVVLGGTAATVIAGRGRTEAMLARRDAVTELPNRRAFEERLAGLIAAGTPWIGVIYIDLDGFKAINDRLGHAGGDELLAACGARIAGTIRPGDFAARVGGDEFAAIVAGSELPVLDPVCERIRTAVEAPFTVAGTPVRVGASMGHAIYPRDGRTAEEIVRAADEAMYRVKHERRAAR